MENRAILAAKKRSGVKKSKTKPDIEHQTPAKSIFETAPMSYTHLHPVMSKRKSRRRAIPAERFRFTALTPAAAGVNITYCAPHRAASPTQSHASPPKTAFSPTLPKNRRSFTPLQPLTPTYSGPAHDTYALTPPLKGVSARGASDHSYNEDSL